MKRMIVFALMLIFILTSAGCASKGSDVSVADKMYIYEHDGHGGEFKIVIYEGGKFLYYEGALSDHIGIGVWITVDSVISLFENGEDGRVNHFEFDGETLKFIEEGSSNFAYVTLEEGDTFNASPIPEGK